jgi:DNA-binding GntR family transcriptional regulator
MASRASSESAIRTEFERQAGSGSITDAVHGTVKTSIERGWMQPGLRLGEEYLADLFEVSRTPVREALMRLEVEHLAVRDRHRGLAVAQISVEQIVELYVIREALDGVAARQTATHGSTLDQVRLEQLNRSMSEAAEAGDYGQMAELNIEFHSMLARASRNEMLERFIDQVHGWVRRFETTTFAYPGRASEAVAEHEALIVALKARLPEESERLAREHMRNAMSVRIELESRPEPSQLDSGRSVG